MVQPEKGHQLARIVEPSAKQPTSATEQRSATRDRIDATAILQRAVAQQQSAPPRRSADITLTASAF